ncbi:glycosyltransferase family 2 protein [Flagelloscypha sp. PMI_526]|nr:glycosyltransferase family 2 protein [Flagelloscypha sp. PMI_526]
MALRFETKQHGFQDIPIPTTRPPVEPSRGATMRRAKTLTRPERSVAPVPLINPGAPGAHSMAQAGKEDNYNGSQAWRIFSKVITFWAPDVLLSSLGGLKDEPTRQAWREKMALCIIIIFLCGCTGFVTVGFQKVLCPEASTGKQVFTGIGVDKNTLSVLGQMYNISRANAQPADGVNLKTIAAQIAGQDITPLFKRKATDFSKCNGINYRIAQDDPCAGATTNTKCPLNTLNPSTLKTLGFVDTQTIAGYSWEQVVNLTNYIVLDGAVLNLTPYFELHPNAIGADAVDVALRAIISSNSVYNGKDGTRIFFNSPDLHFTIDCIKSRYYAGNIDKIQPGCFVSSLILYIGLIVVLGLVMIRFVMACVFKWFLSHRLADNVSSSELNRSAISPAVMPGGANISVDNRNGIAPWSAPGGKKLGKGGPKSTRSYASSTTLTNDGPSTTMSLAQIGSELFAVCLVTCYSEGEDSLRTTLDSISRTDYSDARKLLFIVADGMITGAGEKRSTPDICVSLLEADERFGNPIPMSYLAVGSGSKAHNRAMVYAGHYTVAGRRTPTIIIVKCGTEKEAASDKKPGNRGKRDSQLILMNFFSRVTYNDRMSPLDFDLFRKIHTLMGITPDFFEVCLMVDADTKVFPESLRHLVNCMHHDQMIMGVCGETRIANKRQSWITAIQVFEYFISHHLAKAFESVFGGVTCLPGCFSMFRLKARRSTGEDWVPLIIKPEIVQEYSQSEVTTLHQKNLLLLGEDRFLTTILLRTFPNRKMMFLPQARCRTVVPDTFSMLLSQRRRWINSTIHNLMELVLVRDLCGTFCFSMQFVVFMDLLGTVVLPIAISLTYLLIGSIAFNPPKTFDEAIPAILLVAVLGLPAILIMITTGKVVYVFWMLIYLLALPIWNFILPVYAFWHFDDFSWGETRKVEGEGKGGGHDEDDGVNVVGQVPLRRWEDWERSRLRKIKREERRRRDFERAHPSGFFAGENDLLAAGFDSRSQYDGSDTISVTSSEEDVWGPQVGGYNEDSTKYPPPPSALIPSDEALHNAATIGGADLEAMLEQGFDDRPSSPTYAPRYQLNDNQSSASLAGVGGNGYAPLSRARDPPQPAIFSPTTPQPPHGSEARYGPLGPLDPATKF